MQSVAMDNHITEELKKERSFGSSVKNLKINNPSIPDGGYGWIVVIATFFIYAIAEGISFAFGFLYVEFLDEFKSSKSATSWIGSLFVALPLVSGPICSALVDKYGCQMMTIIGSAICSFGVVFSAYAQSIAMMYVTFGVIGGLARGVCYITVVVSVTYWFEKRRSLALGISASGTGFGTIIFSPLTTFLLLEYGWRGAVLILGGCLANMCVCGALMIDPKWVTQEIIKKETQKVQLIEKFNNEEELKELVVFKRDESNSNIKKKNSNCKIKKGKWFDLEVILSKILPSFSLFTELHFLLLALATLLAGTWFLIPYFYLADHMIASGYSESQASFTLSVIGFMNIIGMIALGWIGDHFNVAKTYAISLILCGFSIWAIMLFTSNYYLLVFSGASFGFFFSCCFSLSPSLLAELVNMDSFTQGFGLILLCEGTGHLIGPPLAGYISDMSKSWAQSFYQSGIWTVAAGICVGIIPFTKNRKLCRRITFEN